MKTQSIRNREENAEPPLRRAEADLLAQVAVVFRRFPDLAGFSVYEQGLGEEIAVPDENKLVVSDIGFCPPVSTPQYAEACKLIHRTISEFLSERPEGIGLLRDRSFARTLH
jgi:hypothetical protein